MTEKKMTQREFFTKAIEIFESTENAEMVEFAKERISALDKRNENRSNKQTKTQIENDVIKSKILELYESGNEVFVASQVGEKLEISTNKASALLRQLALADKLSVCEVKVKGKGKVKGYLMPTDCE